MSPDHLRAARAQTAAALRRLADAAAQEAMLLDFPDAMPDDRDRARSIVIERFEAVKHSRAILQATTAGAARETYAQARTG